ncbi:MAG: tripartite tricarboxylate transporter substrate binding protein [Betaproteobacteria bacterium]|nr:tripartite tricarboxylate transporter substrate binding protein [Betaproteobacteria bacterium]
MIRTIGQVLLSFSMLTMVTASPTVLAQPWPSKPIRIIAPFAPGGGADFMARLTSQPLSAALGQPVVVENRVGASGIIGYDHTLKSAPDGYSIVVVSTTYSIIPSLYKLPYDPVKDMQPIIQLSRGPYIIAVHPSLPVKNISELIALAKASPNPIPYASSGNGANLHLVTEMLTSMAGIKMLHIPFKGTGPAITATVGGQTSVVFGSMYSTLPLVRSGRLRALAVSSAQRNPAAPEIPTVAESGLPGYDTFDWQGVVGPKGIPRPIVDRLNAEFAKILQSKEVSDRLLADGVVPSPSTPEEFGAFVGKEIDAVRGIVAQAGIKLD